MLARHAALTDHRPATGHTDGTGIFRDKNLLFFMETGNLGERERTGPHEDPKVWVPKGRDDNGREQSLEGRGGARGDGQEARVQQGDNGHTIRDPDVGADGDTVLIIKGDPRGRQVLRVHEPEDAVLGDEATGLADDRRQGCRDIIDARGGVVVKSGI